MADESTLGGSDATPPAIGNRPDELGVAPTAVRAAVKARILGEPPPPGSMGPGSVLADRYRLEERIGRGGMGEVWRATHVEIGKPVAIKVVRRAVADATHSQRLLREARAVSTIRHDNVVEITDFGRTESGEPFVVMELLRGRTLAELIEREAPVSWDRAGPLLASLCDALTAAHAVGVIHRDLKPANVFLIVDSAGHERIKVIDFGLAKRLQRPVGTIQTEPGTILGTPAYMAPEQFHARDVDARTDVYALGCIAYEMVTGRRPFGGTTTWEVVEQHLNRVPLPPRSLAPNLSPEVDTLVMRALAKDPADRFENAARMRETIARSLGDRSRSPLVTLLVAVGVLLALTAAGVGYLVSRTLPETNEEVGASAPASVDGEPARPKAPAEPEHSALPPAPDDPSPQPEAAPSEPVQASPPIASEPADPDADAPAPAEPTRTTSPQRRRSKPRKTESSSPSSKDPPSKRRPELADGLPDPFGR